MGYPGGKGNCWRSVVNLMPPHDVYIESHLGGGSVIRNKRPAAANFGIDIDPSVIASYGDGIPTIDLARAAFTAVCGDAVPWLKEYPFSGYELVYCDPPYVMDTRKGGKLYSYEYDDDDHVRLIEVLRGLPCYVMVSGYRGSLYSAMLQGWFTADFPNATRGGGVTETVWMNYKPNGVLHDARFVGENFRERERIKRKVSRWESRLMAMAPSERQAIANAVDRISRDDRPPPVETAMRDHESSGMAMGSSR